MKQTAVECLELLYHFQEGYLSKMDIEQAKQMEKEHLEDCWNVAHQAGRFEGKGIAEEDWQTFEQYYNETYNK